MSSYKAKARRSRSSGEVPHRTALSGTVKKRKRSSGTTNLGMIRGLGNFGNVRVSLNSPLPGQAISVPQRGAASSDAMDGRTGTSSPRLTMMAAGRLQSVVLGDRRIRPGFEVRYDETVGRRMFLGLAL